MKNKGRRVGGINGFGKNIKPLLGKKFLENRHKKIKKLEESLRTSEGQLSLIRGFIEAAKKEPKKTEKALGAIDRAKERLEEHRAFQLEALDDLKKNGKFSPDQLKAVEFFERTVRNRYNARNIEQILGISCYLKPDAIYFKGAGKIKKTIGKRTGE